jgi:hypothetical protein
LDSNFYRTRNGARTTLRKRLRLVPEIIGVSENALALKKRKKGVVGKKRLAALSGLRQVGRFPACAPALLIFCNLFSLSSVVPF